MILDGIHSHPTSCCIATQTHPDGLVLVTDAMAGMGLCAGTYKLGGQNVTIEPGAKKAVLQGTDTIAGSVVTMDECIRTLINATNCAVEFALECAALHPAQLLGLDKKGTLDFGQDADFVLLDEQLHVQATYIDGQCVWRSGSWVG